MICLMFSFRTAYGPWPQVCRRFETVWVCTVRSCQRHGISLGGVSYIVCSWVGLKADDEPDCIKGKQKDNVTFNVSDQSWRNQKYFNCLWYGMIWYDICYDIWYDMWYDIWYMIWYVIWYDIWYDMMCYGIIWYMVWYDMMCYGMIWYMIWYIWYMIWYGMIYDICDMVWYMIWYMIW